MRSKPSDGEQARLEVDPARARGGGGLLDRLLGPHPSLKTLEDQQGARLFAALMLLHVAIVVVLLAVSHPVSLALTGRPIWGEPHVQGTLAGLLVIVVGYLLLRAGAYRVGALCYVGSVATMALVLPFAAAAPGSISMLSLIVLPVLLSTLLLPLRWSAVVLVVLVAANLTGLALVPVPRETLSTGYGLVAIGTILSAIVLLVRRHSDGLERERLAQILDQEEQQRSLEAKLFRAARMESIGLLAGGIAHDFNNLLTAIQGNVELLQEDFTVDHDSRPLLDDIAQAADSASRLTRQLLTFSRKQVIEPRSLDINAVIERVTRLLTRLIGEDVHLEIRLAPGLGTVRADPSQIEQVLVNLAVNARDAMPDGGTLLMETRNVTLGGDYEAEHPSTKAGDYVLIAVSDTGVGMSEEVCSRLFEPFFTTKGQGEGTGLGLATTYGAVKQHDGEIEVYSEPGEGTTFKIYLPRTADEADPDLPRRSTVRMGDATILVVEDADLVRDMCIQALGRAGYTTLGAASGAEALALAAEHDGPLDLLLTDVVMPGMNGRELATRLRAERPELRVLYTSGYTENIIAHHGVVEEGLSFLPKPYTTHALTRRVAELLDAPRPGPSDA